MFLIEHHAEIKSKSRDLTMECPYLHSKQISIVIPCHNEESNVKKLARLLCRLFRDQQYEYDILFVDDGSTDGTLHVLREISSENQHVKFVSFSRNFGHQNALRAGLDIVKGDAVIMMDADFEHPPELIPEMLRLWRNGYDIVYTIRRNRKNMPILKRFTSNCFYRVFSILSGIKIEAGTADFRLLSREVIVAMMQYRERDFFLRGIIADLGFQQKALVYTPGERKNGTSSYSWKRMLSLALDGITSFSILPFRLSALIGVLISLFCFFYGTYAVIMRCFVTEQVLSGWASLLVGIYFLGGIQMLMIGIVGEYIGRLFYEVKKRPEYIIRESNL